MSVQTRTVVQYYCSVCNYFWERDYSKMPEVEYGELKCPQEPHVKVWQHSELDKEVD
jgi:hypothetical protein